MSDDLKYRDDTFLMPFPCFAVESSNGRGFVYQDYDKGKAVVLLTDDDLAQRYRAQHKLTGQPIQLNNTVELLAFLEQMPTAIGFVTLDPGDSRPNVLTLEHAKELLRRQSGL